MSSEWADQPQGASSSGAAPGSHHGADSAPGKILAAQREAMGWTVEQVADQLKLAVRQVVALEAGDAAALPGPAVVRGFVRAYAKIVRLDPAPLVAQIPLDMPGPSDASHTALRHARPASFSEVRFPSHGKRSRAPIVPIIAIIVLVGAGFAAWHYGLVSKFTGKGNPAAGSVAAPATGGSTSSSTSTSVLAPATSVAAPAVPAATSTLAVPNLQNPSVPLISVPPPSAVTPGSPLAAVASGAAGAAGAVAPAAPAAAAVATGANSLVLTANKDSWIQVKAARGAPLLSRLVKAGSTETVEVNEPVTLTVGNPDGVSATLRGSAVALPVTRAGAVAKVELK